jgi:hypothetical protein
MVSSTSGTGSPGGMNEIPLISDQNAAAATLRTAMGIVKNLDTIIFTDVDKRALWKYDTSSNNPMLHPMGQVRINTSANEGSDDSWKDILQDLVDDLPSDVKTAYEKNLLLPPESKNTSLVALGRLLEGTAKALNWLENSAMAINPENPAAGPGSAADERKNMNIALANGVMNGISTEGNATIQGLQNQLLQIGANNPHFNDLQGFMNQVGMAYNTIIVTNRPKEG